MNEIVANLWAPWNRSAAASIRLYFYFIRLAFLKYLAYRLRYYTGVVSYTIFVTGHYYIYSAIFAGAVSASAEGTIGGLTLPEMITYVAISWIGRSFYFNSIARELSRMVQEGEIAVLLVRPIHVQTVMMFEAIGESGFRLLMFTLPIMVVIVPLFGINGPPEPMLYLWTFVSFCMALVIYSQFNFLLGCLAFGMKNIQGVLRAKMVSMDFLTGVVVPFTFFPEWFQAAMNWLPFQYISYVPVTIYLGKRTGDDLVQALLIQAGWSLGLFVLGRIVWHRSVRHVIVQGG
ncbi:MAG: ABC-2 type transport system permease protein [Candidatus Krumholzibacteriia bacterium]|jgi:ABC-2 type transport system permease protein